MDVAAGSVVVIGGANLDTLARSSAALVTGTSNPGTTVSTAGGVGRNIAENLARLGTPTHLITAVGDDESGTRLLGVTEAAGVDVGTAIRGPVATGTYTAVLDHDGELLAGVADMAAIDQITPDVVGSAADLIAAADLLILDGNLRLDTLAAGLALAAASGTEVLLDPVSVPKAARIASLIGPDRPIAVLTPNRDELLALTAPNGRLAKDREPDLGSAVDSLHRRGVEVVWVRLGAAGSMLVAGDEAPIRLDAFAADVVDVTGAGDAMLAGFAHARLSGADLTEAGRYAHAAAALTIASAHTVRPDLTDALIRSCL